MKMDFPYEDIIHHPHHVSKNHPQMSKHDRAAQFSAFAALPGYDDALKEEGPIEKKAADLRKDSEKKRPSFDIDTE